MKNCINICKSYRNVNKCRFIEMDIEVHRPFLYALILKMKSFVKKARLSSGSESHSLRYASNILACACLTSSGKEISYGSVTCGGILPKIYIKVSIGGVIGIFIIYFRRLIGTIITFFCLDYWNGSTFLN